MSTPAADTAARRETWKTVRPWFLGGIAAAAIIGTIASFYESFSGLVDWFRRIGFTGDRAILAPAMIDLVAVVGEVVALLAIVEGWRSRKIRGLAWTAIIYGLALSVIGNAGRNGLHLSVAGVFSMAWNAVPPLSLAILMTVALAVVKLWFKADEEETDSTAVPGVPEDALAALIHFRTHAELGTLPTVREVRAAVHCNQDRAGRIRTYLEQFTEAFGAPGQGGPDRERVSS